VYGIEAQYYRRRLYRRRETRSIRYVRGFRSSRETLNRFTPLHRSRHRPCDNQRMADITPRAARYAYAVDIRSRDTVAVQGVALVVPSGRHASLLAAGASIATNLELPDDIWREIDAWAADGNARLPARPAPMSRSIVEALLGVEQAAAVSAQRFAAIPIAEESHEALGRMADGLLPGLLKARRSAA
jgi:hypothetical protein